MGRLSSVATTTDGQGTLLYHYPTQDRRTIVRHKPNFNQQENAGTRETTKPNRTCICPDNN